MVEESTYGNDTWRATSRLCFRQQLLGSSVCLSLRQFRRLGLCDGYGVTYQWTFEAKSISNLHRKLSVYNSEFAITSSR